MPVAELEKFRQKYPQYGDISDIDLSTKLAQKYPQAYGDLPKKASMASNVNNPDMQGGANSPALVKSRQDVVNAQRQTQPLSVIAKAGRESTKSLPFGNPEMAMSPRNIIGEGAKAASFALGPVAGGATYMAGQSIENKDKPLTLAAKTAAGAAGGKLTEVALPVIAKAGATVVKGAMDLLPKHVTERMYQLYNEAIKPRVGQFKVKGDLESYKKDHLDSTMSIKNNPNLHFEDPVTGEVYNQPRNKQDYLQAIDDTQKSVWKDKVQSMSKGATAKGVMIDTESIAKKTLGKIINDKNLQLVEPGLVNEAKGLIEQAKVNGRQTPEEVEDLLTKLNNKSAMYWANKNKNATDAYVELAGSLRKEMEDKIEGALQQGGYLDARKEYGALKRIKQDVLRSTANQIFKGDSTLGDKLLDTFAGEELVRGLLTMRPESIAMSGSTKAYQLLRQYLRNPDRKVRQMFELAQRFSPKSNAVNATYAAAHNPTRSVRPQDISDAQILQPKGLPNLPNKIGLNRALPSPRVAGKSSGPVINQGGKGMEKLPAPEKRLGLPEPTEVKGEGFTMKKTPSKGQVISKKEAGRDPSEEDPEAVIISKEDMTADREKRAVIRQSKAEERKDATGFLKDIRGTISSKHISQEEFQPVKNLKGLFSKGGKSADYAASELAKKYPYLFDYKDPDEVRGEDIVRAVQLARKSLNKSTGFLGTGQK